MTRLGFNFYGFKKRRKDLKHNWLCNSSTTVFPMSALTFSTKENKKNAGKDHDEGCYVSLRLPFSIAVSFQLPAAFSIKIESIDSNIISPIRIESNEKMSHLLLNVAGSETLDTLWSFPSRLILQCLQKLKSLVRDFSCFEDNKTARECLRN